MSRKLYVGNIPYETNEQDLQELFGQAGVDRPLALQTGLSAERLRDDSHVEVALAAVPAVDAALVVMAGVPRGIVLDHQVLRREGGLKLGAN